MTGQDPVLDLVYPDAEAFRRDYEADLCNGGVFVPSDQELELRTTVRVKLVLAWCERELLLDGEVVHRVGPEMSSVGAKPGVAVQFSEAASEVRERLAPLTFDPAPGPKLSARDTRRAPRKAARVAARIDWNCGQVMGCTRNLSRSGVLIGVPEGAVPVGEAVAVTMAHPVTGAEFEVHGEVARHVCSDERVVAVGIEFESDEDCRNGVEHFIDDVMGAEHTRRLGAISGPIAELGPLSIVQMLAASAQQGTIVLRRGEEEGIICFDAGTLQGARLGASQGMKALIRLFSWRDGTFEFTSGVEDTSSADQPLPFEAAMFEAARQIDEAARIDTQSFPLQARLVRGEERDTEHSTIEAALLDLASAGFTVSRALEVIPDPDPAIFRALKELVDAKELELH